MSEAEDKSEADLFSLQSETYNEELFFSEKEADHFYLQIWTEQDDISISYDIVNVKQLQC